LSSARNSSCRSSMPIMNGAATSYGVCAAPWMCNCNTVGEVS
jgi:hypothetical protein